MKKFVKMNTKSPCCNPHGRQDLQMGGTGLTPSDLPICNEFIKGEAKFVS